jgi:hypothetical protein
MSKASVSNVGEPDLGRLLSGRNEPSVLEKEAALELVLAQVGAPPRRWPWGARVAAAGLPAFAAALAVVLVFFVGSPSGDIASEDGFQARGDGTNASVASFALRCVNEDPAAASRPDDVECRQGTVLGFSASPPTGKTHFAAFAQRSDGAVLWYFPEAGGQSASLKAEGGAKAVLPRGVPLGAEHPPGSYEVYGVFSSTPLSRERLRKILGPDLVGRADSVSGSSVVVARRQIEVLP